VIVFVCVILIFDMTANDAQITHALYAVLRSTAYQFDDYAGSVASFLNRG
jgi:hypothetical protein